MHSICRKLFCKRAVTRFGQLQVVSFVQVNVKITFKIKVIYSIAMAIRGFKKLLEEAPKHSWIETGTAIFSFFNIVALSISTIVSFGFLILLTLSHYLMHDVDPDLWYLCLACSLGTVLAFTFATLLFRGMYQKKPSFVLAYFIFGVVLDLCLVSLLLFVVIDETTDEMRTKPSYKFLRYQKVRYVYSMILSGYSMILGVCVVYTLVLGMVCHTYFWMKKNRCYHQRLIDGRGKEELSSPVSTISEKY